LQLCRGSRKQIHAPAAAADGSMHLLAVFEGLVAHEDVVLQSEAEFAALDKHGQHFRASVMQRHS
jgi:hypothetical protein